MAHNNIETVGGFLHGIITSTRVKSLISIIIHLNISHKSQRPAAVLDDVFRGDFEDLEMRSPLNFGSENSSAEFFSVPNQLTRRVDALYLLSLLLTGQQRSKVQETLAKLGIGPLLSGLFEEFLWK